MTTGKSRPKYSALGQAQPSDTSAQVPQVPKLSSYAQWIKTGSLPEGIRVYFENKVIEGRGLDKKAECVSYKFGEWNGKSCIAEGDPNRAGRPKGWK
jgi:hypothetical protein